MSPALATVHPLPTRRPRTRSPELDELRRIEAQLETEWEQLQDDGYGFSGALDSLASSDAQDRTAVLRAADELQESFLTHLDDFQRLQHAHFLQQVERELDQAMDMMIAFYGRRRIWSIVLRYHVLKRLASQYRKLEELYGTPKDHQRIAVYQKFYAGVVAFSKQIRALDPTMPRPAPRSLVENLYALRRAVVRFVTRIPSYLLLAWTALRIVWTVFSKKKAGAGTPVTKLVDRLFRTLGRIRGHSIEVNGREAVGEASPDTVTLWVPTHRHGATDNVTFAHLDLPDYMVFNAIDQLRGMPGFLKERTAETPGLIPVGGGRGSSVERALSELGHGNSRNILIYPEGSVSEGFRGTRPPRQNFGEVLVPRIREAGHAVRLVPISYLDNARFLDLPPLSNRPEDRHLRVEIQSPIEDAAVAALLDAGGGAMLNRMVRLAWLEKLETNQRTFLGHDRVREIERRLDLELDGIRYWGSLESPPVADQLEFETEESLEICDEPLRNKRVQVLEVPVSAQDTRGRIHVKNLAEPDSNEFLIGIRPPSHIYLNVGRQRFDGDIFRPLSVKERDYVYPGIVVRFQGVPVKSLNAIRRKLEEYSGRESRTLTCANSACQVIGRAANIRIADHADMRPFLPSHVLATRTIRKLIERGVRNHAGESVQYQVYKLDPRPLEVILAEMRRAEVKIAKDHLKGATIGAWRALVASVRKLVSRLRR